MRTEYGYQIYRKDQTLRVEASGFASKSHAVDRAHDNLDSNRDSHAIVLSYHWQGGKFLQARHIKRIEAPR